MAPPSPPEDGEHSVQPKEALAELGRPRLVFALLLCRCYMCLGCVVYVALLMLLHVCFVLLLLLLLLVCCYMLGVCMLLCLFVAARPISADLEAGAGTSDF